VQGIFPLRIANAGVRLTTAKVYSPSGQPISRYGVQPDVIVRATAKPVDGEATPVGHDPVLAAGIEVARQGLAQR
jgi:carboxyl-terminal processing protease